MVTCILQGGIASQFFTTLATIAYSKKHKMQYCIPTQINRFLHKHYRFDNVVYDDIDTTSFYKYRSPDVINEDSPYDVSYHEIPFHENIVLYGHFRSWKYFDGIIDPKCYFSKIQLPPNPAFYTRRCSVVVRIGDYSTTPQYLLQGIIEYLKRALWLVTGNEISEVIGYCDNLAWLKQLLSDMYFKRSLPFIPIYQVADHGSEINNLSAIAMNKYIIGSNSLYSLMAYYLNPHWDKKIFLPKEWFNPWFEPVDCTDLYPPGCVIL